MNTLILMIQITVALGLLNVWFLRFNRSTPYRGGDARTMSEEFAAYGLPPWSVAAIGTLKVGAALALLAGIWLPGLVLPAALLIVVLMIGAVSMHLKIGDRFSKAVPALVMLILSSVITAAAAM